MRWWWPLLLLLLCIVLVNFGLITALLARDSALDTALAAVMQLAGNATRTK